MRRKTVPPSSSALTSLRSLSTTVVSGFCLVCLGCCYGFAQRNRHTTPVLPGCFRHKECEISDLKRQLAARDAEVARLRGVTGEEGEGESDRESDHGGDGEEEEGLGPEAVAFSVNA